VEHGPGEIDGAEESVVSTWDRKSSGLISSKNPALKLPALLTSTSMRPNRAMAGRTAFSVSASSVTSS
jgi:hypothetical protein